MRVAVNAAVEVLGVGGAVGEERMTVLRARVLAHSVVQTRPSHALTEALVLRPGATHLVRHCLHRGQVPLQRRADGLHRGVVLGGGVGDGVVLANVCFQVEKQRGICRRMGGAVSE